MKSIFSITLLIIIFSSTNLFPQVTQEWVASYHNFAVDIAYDIVVDDSGNVYVTGESRGLNNNIGSMDYATVKYNSAGIQQWVRRYNGPGNDLDRAVSIAVDDSGNVYVTGFSRSEFMSAFSDYATIKYNTSGVQQWVQRYNGPKNRNDIATSIAVDDSRNVYVSGWSDGIGTLADYTTIKYSPTGIQLWIQRYSVGGDNYVYDMVLDENANVYVTRQWIPHNKV